MSTEIEKNQDIILRYLYQKALESDVEEYVDGDNLHKATNLKPVQINEAVELLSNLDLVECYTTLGTEPYNFWGVRITPSGKWEVERKRSLEREVSATEVSVKDPKKVFVIHGRNLKARDNLFIFLRSIGLSPIEWSQAVQATGKGSPYIGEILDKAFSIAQAVVVLMTPDDEARLREFLRKPEDPPYETELTPQARANVLFEAGWAMGLFPDRTILVELGKLRPFTDIGGRYVIRLDNTPQKRQELAQRLKIAECPVDLSGTDWYSVGNFEIELYDTFEERRRKGRGGEEKKEPRLEILSSFDKSFKALEEATHPKTKRIMLSEFQPKIRNLCYNFDWNDEIRDRIIKVLKHIPKNLSSDPNIDCYLQYLGMMIKRHGEHTIPMVKEKFLDELENLYNDPKFETNFMILNILQKLHDYSEDYMMELIDDASSIIHWSDQRFQALGGNIELWELGDRDEEAYERVLEHLRQKMNDAEKNKDEKTYDRLRKLYALVKR